MRQILERLLISDLSEAGNPTFLDIHRIQAILYYGDGGMFPDHLYLYQRTTLPDGTLSQGQLRDAVEFLVESLRAGRRVLAVGPNAPTIVAAYLAEMGFGASQAEKMASTDDYVKPSRLALEDHQRSLIHRNNPALHREVAGARNS